MALSSKVRAYLGSQSLSEKNGKVYIMDADALGGFKQGPSGTDGIIQTITIGKAVFGGVGSYPLEGGFM